MLKFKSTPEKIVKGWTGFTIICLISFQSISQTYPIDTLMRNGERYNRVNFVYLSDGYLGGQLPAFITNATAINNALFGQTPFVQYKNYFNSYAIRIPSGAEGAKHPGTASDEDPAAPQPIVNPATFFESTFDYSSIHRLLFPLNTAGIYDVLAKNLPDYSQAFIVVNSPYYGGSGNLGGDFATASVNAASAEIAIHEIGHSFGGLADEYWAGDVYAAERPNMTMNANPLTVKWKNWLGINGIGIYSHAENTSWYRPHQSCKMRSLHFNFCSVCTERFIDVIHQNVNMIDAYTPASTSFALSNNNPIDFSISAVQTNPSTLEIKWYLNGSTTPFATNQYSVTLPASAFTNSTNTVRAEVVDNTGLSKSYLPHVGYVNNLTWTILKPVELPVRLISFSGRINNNAALLNWNIDTPDDLRTFELEKSRDGIHFTRLATIAGQAAKRSYHYSDNEILGPYMYYRLNIIENSGSSHYSNIIRLQKAFDKFYYKVYQNVESRMYHLSVGITQPEKVSYKITDIKGRVVLKKDFGKVEKQLEHDFHLAGRSAGIYFMALHFSNYPYTIQLIAK